MSRSRRLCLYKQPRTEPLQASIHIVHRSPLNFIFIFQLHSPNNYPIPGLQQALLKMTILTHILPITLLIALTTASPLGDLTAFNPSLPVSIPFPGFKLDKTEVIPILVSSSSSIDDNEALNKALALYSASASGSGMDTVVKRDTPYIFVCTDVDFSGKCQKLYHNRESSLDHVYCQYSLQRSCVLTS